MDGCIFHKGFYHVVFKNIKNLVVYEQHDKTKKSLQAPIRRSSLTNVFSLPSSQPFPIGVIRNPGKGTEKVKNKILFRIINVYKKKLIFLITFTDLDFNSTFKTLTTTKKLLI